MTIKFFTPRQANQRLPYVKKIVEEILSRGKQIKALLMLPHPTREREKELLELEKKINALMKELETLGCLFKDWNFEIGLVDFPTILNGQEALLCWRSDELAVAWFHGYDEGYPGRQPITAELIFS